MIAIDIHTHLNHGVEFDSRPEDYGKLYFAEEERIFFWTVLDPFDKNSYLQAGKMLKSPKCLGIKIHSVCHNYEILEYGGEIFDFANRMKAWILMHNDKILSMPALADNNPDMKLIIAHLGTLDHIEAIKKPNTEISIPIHRVWRQIKTILLNTLWKMWVRKKSFSVPIHIPAAFRRAE